MLMICCQALLLAVISILQQGMAIKWYCRAACPVLLIKLRQWEYLGDGGAKREREKKSPVAPRQTRAEHLMSELLR